MSTQMATAPSTYRCFYPAWPRRLPFLDVSHVSEKDHLQESAGLVDLFDLRSEGAPCRSDVFALGNDEVRDRTKHSSSLNSDENLSSASPCSYVA